MQLMLISRNLPNRCRSKNRGQKPKRRTRKATPRLRRPTSLNRKQRQPPARKCADVITTMDLVVLLRPGGSDQVLTSFTIQVPSYVTLAVTALNNDDLILALIAGPELFRRHRASRQPHSGTTGFYSGGMHVMRRHDRFVANLSCRRKKANAGNGMSLYDRYSPPGTEKMPSL